MFQKITRNIDHPIMLTLLCGMILSVVLIVVGLILLAIHPQSHHFHVLPLHKAAVEMVKLHASGWLSLGLFILILTPLARVAMAIGSFAFIKDWKYVIVSIVVFAAMLIGLFSGKG